MDWCVVMWCCVVGVLWRGDGDAYGDGDGDGDSVVAMGRVVVSVRGREICDGGDPNWVRQRDLVWCWCGVLW